MTAWGGAFASARWIDVRHRSEILPALPALTLLHAGPPLRGAPPPAVLQAAIQALLFEELFADPDAARAAIGAGKVRLEPAQDHGVVTPLAQVVSASMLLHVVAVGDTRRHAPLVEGPPPALRFGSLDPGARQRLRILQASFDDSLTAQLRAAPLDLAAVVEAGILGGDECHARTGAAGAALTEALASRDARAATALAGNPGFVLPLLMAAASAALVHRASDVVAIGGNGIDFGLRRRGAAGWRQLPALPPVGGRLPGDELTPPLGAIGDSAVIDYCGLGGQALAIAPQLAAEWRDCLPADALLRRDLITFAGSGIVDAGAVAALGRGPLVNLAILDAAGKTGLIGRGIYEVPPALFAVG